MLKYLINLPEDLKMSHFDATVDARTYEPKLKHAILFNTLKDLTSGQKMELINEHDPSPLYHAIMTEYPGQLEWQYLEEGPDIWRVSITKK